MTSKTWIETGRNVPSRHAFVTLAGGLWRMIAAGYARSSQRRQLFTLSDHQLRDIGLRRLDIEAEWRKPFWRA